MNKTHKSQKHLKNNFINLLSELPSAAKFDKHYWADYLELKCLVNKDRQFTQAEFNDLLTDNIDFEPSIDVIDTEYIDKKDNFEIFVQDCFDLINYRQKIFLDYYPYELFSKKVLKRKPRLSNKHKLYFFFLFCSSLKYTANHQSILTSSFEILGKEIFKNLLPKGAKVYLFGSANSLDKDKRYTGNLLKKVTLLATDLFEKTPVNENNFAPTDVGDNGLDLVGWVPNGDNDSQSHLLILFGQAACTPQWESKQHSSSYQAWKNTINISVPPINVILIPYSIRNNTGDWHKSHSIGGNLLLDRQRLLFHFKDNFKVFKNWPSFSIVNDLVKEEEPIF